MTIKPFSYIKIYLISKKKKKKKKKKKERKEKKIIYLLNFIL